MYELTHGFQKKSTKLIDYPKREYKLGSHGVEVVKNPQKQSSLNRFQVVKNTKCTINLNKSQVRPDKPSNIDK